jgi:hypothetical protein
MATAIKAKVQDGHEADGRREERRSVAMRGSARVAVSIDVFDLSRNGVRARVSLPLPIGTLIRIGLGGEHSRHGRVVWTEDGVTGFEFLAPLTVREFHAICTGAGAVRPTA